jgi:hypothetical protein
MSKAIDAQLNEIDPLLFRLRHELLLMTESQPGHKELAHKIAVLEVLQQELWEAEDA